MGAAKSFDDILEGQIVSEDTTSTTNQVVGDMKLKSMRSTEIARKPSIQPTDQCDPGFNIVETFDTLAQQIPSLWSFEYQMGTEPYLDAFSRSQGSDNILGRVWTESNSPFSDHIQVLQRLMTAKAKHMIPISSTELSL